MTSFITFHFLFQFVLTNEALMFRCVIIIRENLSEQHVHVVRLVMSRIWPIRNAYLASWQWVGSLCLFRDLLLHTFLPEVKHFPSEGLRHDALAGCASDLIEWIIRVLDCVWSFRFCLLHDSGSIISCILWWPIEIRIRQICPVRVIKTRCSLECRRVRIHLSHIYPWTKTALRWIKVGTSLEGLVHLIDSCKLLF